MMRIKTEKIDEEEITIFKNDCKKLYAGVYGEDSNAYKKSAELLDKTKIEFNDIQNAGEINPEKNDFGKQQYCIKS